MYDPERERHLLPSRFVDTTVLFENNYTQAIDATGRYWWREGDPVSTSSQDYPQSATVRKFLELVEEGIIYHGENPTAIDLGSGQGYDAMRLAKLGYWTIGIDASPTGVKESYAEAAHLLTERQNRRVEFKRNDVTKEILGQERFNLIWCRGVLDYLSDDEKKSFIQRIKVGARVGGVVVFHTVTDDPKPRDTPQHRAVPLIPDRGATLTRSLFKSSSSWQTLWELEEHGKPHDDPSHTHSHYNGIFRKIKS
jgi:2-polyprenyl-3-methyl-5-hydroxy-6-metoxy-1,4-benzoquinol methylase